MNKTNNDSKILIEIKELLNRIDERQELKENDFYLNKAEKRIDYATNQIQNSFNRIHDKLFNLNNIMIGAFLVLGTYPNESPKINLWLIIFPILNLIFLIYIEHKQKEVHRFASNEMDWTDPEREKYGNLINTQTLFSLASIFVTILIVFLLVISVLLS